MTRGDVLARIDPTVYQAQFDQVSAKKAQDEAQLANARLDLQRYQKLLETYAASRQQADTQKALVAQLEAQTRADQAAIDNASALLSYTTIMAPIDGRTGLRMVDIGNLVRAGEPPLVVITQITPIAVLFNLPQQHLRAVSTANAKGDLAVEALDADNRTVIDKGVLQVVDNQVDQTTGTVRIKASFPNADRQLWPGQFVNIRLFVSTIPHAVVIPTAAIQRGPNEAYVYVVRPDSRVEQRSVAVTQQDEREAVIGSGVTPPDQVVTTGFTRLTDGADVRATATASEPAALEGGTATSASNSATAPAPSRPATAAAAPLRGPDRLRGHDGWSGNREGGEHRRRQ